MPKHLEPVVIGDGEHEVDAHFSPAPKRPTLTRVEANAHNATVIEKLASCHAIRLSFPYLTVSLGPSAPATSGVYERRAAATASSSCASSHGHTPRSSRPTVSAQSTYSIRRFTD